ncbi:MAG: PEGA domain-containing protein [Terriglobales bacterium]
MIRILPVCAVLILTAACFNRVGEMAGPPNAPMARLAIHSDPANASILIDGKFVGDSPATVIVSASQHSVQLDKSGFATWQRTIDVEGWHAHLNVHLHKTSTTVGQ